jgi:hypothetical protein
MAAACLVGTFTIGGLANFGRALLMRTSGLRIVAKLRRDTYQSALQQEVNFIESSEGDVLSRLSVDTNIVGESCVSVIGMVSLYLYYYLLQRDKGFE